MLKSINYLTFEKIILQCGQALEHRRWKFSPKNWNLDKSDQGVAENGENAVFH